MANENPQKSPKYFCCETCDYNTCNKKDYKKHLLTRKHEKLGFANDLANMANDKIPKIPKIPKIANKKYECGCGKFYMHKSSLCKHGKKCKYIKKEEVTDTNTQELIMKLINENQELKNTLVIQNTELQKTITDLIPKIGNNNNTINNKQRFNINMFLNEKCKDAITMKEFIDKIEVSMENLLTTRDKGLGDGLTSIIMDNMNKLSVYERPIHCTDKKRETVYVKNDEWERDETCDQLNELVRKVENKQIKNINQWTDEHPDYMENDKLQEEYIDLMRGCTSSIDACKDKVIRKVCDKVYVTGTETSPTEKKEPL
jgi:hypothetical protein